MKRMLFWDAEQTPTELHEMLSVLGTDYPIASGSGTGTCLSFERVAEAGRCEIRVEEATAKIMYSTPTQAGRALGALFAGLVPDKAVYRESTPFTMVGIMLDCSRGAVKTVNHLQQWLRQLALLGYNTVMLYTEDTYELPDEPYFGYQRGAFTKEEIKQLDDYAASLNIEIIPCIQTLGHCEKFLRHAAYADLRDTDRILLIGEEKTYQLIDKMIGHWKSICRTDRIHVGMDETQGMGSGKYYKKHGDRNHFELFNEHLEKVVEICNHHKLNPMIWSDMYFCIGAPTGEYYDFDAVIPQSVVDTIPQDAQLVYWDYYHDDKAFYLDWIKRHRAMGKEPLMASGIWTWNKYWYDHRFTESKAGACIDACLEENIREILFTQWGDNGNYCDHDSAFAGVAWCADKCYGTQTPCADQLEARFEAVCGGSYAAHILASDIHGIFPPPVKGWEYPKGEPNMWDDPLFGTRFRIACEDDPIVMKKIATPFSTLAEKLAPLTNDNTTGSLNYAHATAQAFADRYHLISALIKAYRAHDFKALELCRQQIPAVRKSVAAMAQAFRTMWLIQNKPEGLEEIQSRFGMLDIRYAEMECRLNEYIQGNVSDIPELSCKCPPNGKAK